LAGFAIGSLLLVALAGAGALVAMRAIASGQAVDDAKEVTRLVAHSIVEPVLSDGVRTERPDALAAIDRVVHTRVLGGVIVRVKLWSRSGRILYSDEPRLIGRSFGLEPDELALSRGELKAGLTDLQDPENRFDRGFKELLEVYVPVRTRDGTPLIFETYQRFSSVAADASHVWSMFLPALAGALLIAWAIQIPLAWRMARRVQAGQAERGRLLLRAMDASFAERKRIAASVHDGALQELVGLSYSLSAAAEGVGSGDPAATDASATLGGAAAALRRTARGLRTLVVEIYPPTLHAAGMEAALSDLVAGAAARGVGTTLDDRVEGRLPEATEALLFRGAQEAVRNAIAYAHATMLTVAIRSGRGVAELEVSDDGVGFSPERLARRRAEGHVGLQLLTDMVQEAGGRLDVESNPGAGTRIRLEVPA
jgi:two-component system, NarL family, sensor kinase